MKKIFFLNIILFNLLFLFFIPLTAEAGQNVKFTPQVEIPGMENEGYIQDPETGQYYTYVAEGSNEEIARYIRLIYNYGLGIVGIVATVVLAYGGVMWLTSAGNQDKISRAKKFITGALTGLMLLLVSYTLLRTINPNLVSFENKTNITKLENLVVGCCLSKDTEEAKVAAKGDPSCKEESFVPEARPHPTRFKSCTLKGCCKCDVKGGFIKRVFTLNVFNLTIKDDQCFAQEPLTEDNCRDYCFSLKEVMKGNWVEYEYELGGFCDEDGNCLSPTEAGGSW